MRDAGVAFLGGSALLAEVVQTIKEGLGGMKPGAVAIARTGTEAEAEALPVSRWQLEIGLSSCDVGNHVLLDPFVGFVRHVADATGLRLVRGPAPLPTAIERWTVLSSPFVHKTARTQFERRTHRRVLLLAGIHDRSVLERLTWYLGRHVPVDVQLRLTAIEHLSPE
jgi:small subunit ribosomal protein S10